MEIEIFEIGDLVNVMGQYDAIIIDIKFEKVKRGNSSHGHGLTETEERCYYWVEKDGKPAHDFGDILTLVRKNTEKKVTKELTLKESIELAWQNEEKRMQVEREQYKAKFVDNVKFYPDPVVPENCAQCGKHKKDHKRPYFSCYGDEYLYCNEFVINKDEPKYKSREDVIFEGAEIYANNKLNFYRLGIYKRRNQID